MALTPAIILSSFFTILDSGSTTAAIAVRAALGNGATSVISADDLAVGALPTAPFIAMRGGPIAGTPAWDAENMTVAWWVYDDWGSYKYSRIDALISLIDAAYPNDSAIAGVNIRRINVGAPFRDAALGQRPARSLTYQIKWR